MYITLHSKWNLVTDDMTSKENYFIRKYQSISNIPKDIPNLFILGYGNTLKKAIFPNSLTNLKSITIGNECYKHVREFVIDSLESLESVEIGYKCFRISEEERDDGICRITNCPNLRHLDIDYWSFEDFKSFELSNLNSIQSIQFGDCCFKHAEEFSLKGW